MIPVLPMIIPRNSCRAATKIHFVKLTESLQLVVA